MTDTASARRSATTDRTGWPKRIVIVGDGFAGYFAARKLGRALSTDEAHITLICDTDSMLYQPLLPNVAVGLLNPRSIMVPLTTTLRRVHLVRATARRVDLNAQVIQLQSFGGRDERIEYDQLVLAPGSVTRLFDIPGLAEHALGFKTTAEALYLRDLVLRRLEWAADEPDREKRRSLLTFVVVGAGYAGTELVAQSAVMTRAMVDKFSELDASDLHWLLLDTASTVLPELGDHLGQASLKVLKRRGVDVRLKTTIQAMDGDSVTLTDGDVLDGAVVVWCAGVAPSPLIGALGLPTARGRLVVAADLGVPGHPELYALGDAAAVPDLTKPKDQDGHHPVCPPTAQHAMRQGTALAANVIADVRGQPRRDYRHHDLGLVVDLGGSQAAAKPLGVPLTGRLAKAVTLGYHVFALPTLRRRARVLIDWALAGEIGDDVSLGMSDAGPTLASAEHDRQHFVQESHQN